MELTLLMVDAWNRRDLEAFIAFFDPEGVWSPAFERITEGRAFRGHAEMRQAMEGLAEFSEESHVEFPEVHDLGDPVLCRGHFSMRFASGVELDQEVAALITWRNGKCVPRQTLVDLAAVCELLAEDLPTPTV